MQTAQVEGRIEETIGKLKEVAGKVIGNKALEEAGATQKTAGQNKAIAGDQEATVLLRHDHEIVSDLFDEYEETDVQSEKKSLVSRICTELTIHAQVEEEIFYPAVKQALNDSELVPEAIAEHAKVKALIAQVEGVEPDGEEFDSKIKLLSEQVKHHVQEEQNELFPRARATTLDMLELGARIASRKEQLVGERARRS